MLAYHSHSKVDFPSPEAAKIVKSSLDVDPEVSELLQPPSQTHCQATRRLNMTEIAVETVAGDKTARCGGQQPDNVSSHDPEFLQLQIFWHIAHAKACPSPAEISVLWTPGRYGQPWAHSVISWALQSALWKPLASSHEGGCQQPVLLFDNRL